ncbi:SDR family NAD(P)-dependent oxidoreductase [Demequina globuliformis]|uniref:SDR family NAD(P)-dependent oxidoreductase n=1 Tax=Demequina globuliformis TaxID=676202 RepID=UPI000782A9DE|nr:SDR family NAD(P)-dependent oxidoreductase [Demequina globuliformis]
MKTIVITGASDGIGAAAARELAKRGHRLVLVGRNPDKTAEVAGGIGASHHVCDFAELDQVRDLAERLRAEHPQVDVLANNAGGVMGERSLTADGNEKTFQVNHLAPFLLTLELLPALQAAHATVIQTSSMAARLYAKFDIEDLQNARDYSVMSAYGNAKLENILFTEELQRRYGDSLNAAAFHPGVVGSNFAAGSGGPMEFMYHGPLKRLVTVTPERGADQLVWLAEAAPGTDFEPGRYYVKRSIPRKVNPAVGNAELGRRLWEQSEELVGL